MRSYPGSQHLLLALLAALPLVASSPVAAQSRSLVFQSGSGSIGSQDPLVWVQGSPNVQPGVPSSGLPRQHPFILATPRYWGDVAGARWVSPRPDGQEAPFGYEYFVEFDQPNDVRSAILDLAWRGDDRAWPALNGVRLPGSGGFLPSEPHGALHLDVSSLVRGGTNRLSFFVQNSNLGVNPTGVVFYAVITFAQGGSPAPVYAITDLGGTAREARAINATGQATGSPRVAGGATRHAFLYSDGVMRDLGTLGGTTSDGFGINITGHVVGRSLIAGDAAHHAFLYRDGAMTDLGTLGGSSSEAFGINALDQVVGFTSLTGDRAYHAFLYSGSVMRDLGTLGGGFSHAWSINDLGQVVGWALDPVGTKHAFLYSGRGMIDLGTLGGSQSGADFIHNSGEIVGFSQLPGNANFHGFLYRNGAMQDVGTLGGGNSEAFSINQSGQVVGAALTSGNQALHAFLYANGVMKDLNVLIPPDSGWELVFAFSSNDAGQIVGRGILGGQEHAYLLTPIRGTG